MSDADSVARVVNVSHRYGATAALRDVTLDLPAGCIVGLIGPDGVGKSTLLGLLAGVRELQTGSVSVLDADMASARSRNLSGPRIAYMPQGLGKNLYSDLSVAENLQFFGRLFGLSRRECETRSAQLTEATGLARFVERPAGKLSGGMKQKLGLCCALIHDPDLLILDEPTTGVDPLSRRQFWSLIDSIRVSRPGMSILVSTAYMDEAERFDWLVAMNSGAVLATGTPENLKTQTGKEDLERAYIALLPEGDAAVDAFHLPPRKAEDGPPAITAKGLTLRFGDFTAVDNVEFSIQAGEIFGFLGSNGCGKTTTMKMLTGLLPPSEGEVSLWDAPVRAADLEARRRIGFMSQHFSLYGELSVRQNLVLHARIFGIDPRERKTRIDSLITRFNLSEHAGQQAGQLPLGLRQRLSLAVALIHQPTILILDEPTSGVDPVARDDFWKILVELSRKDGVTIFISTHFMNEALRCDRISLMHAGRVLAQDTPAALIAAKATTTLEEAFILYMEEAAEEVVEAVATERRVERNARPDPARGLVREAAAATGSRRRQSTRFSPQRLLAYARRETLEVMRDRIRLAFAFFGSLILLFIFTYGISTDVDNIRFASFDQDRSPASRAYLRSFEGSPYFTELAPLDSVRALERGLMEGRVEVAIEFPPNFGRDLKRGGVAEVSAWIDGANTFRAGTVEGYVRGAHADYLAAQAQAAPAFRIEPRFKYNPTMENIYAMAPSIPAMLLILFPAILMTVSVAREKEIGTITNFYVTPTTRLEFMVGKQLPYIGIGFINFVTLALFVVFVMGVPITGSVVALALGGLLYVAATTALGLLFSSLVRTQVAAVFVTAVLTMMPTMQFSGMLQPVSTLEDSGRLIGSLWPTTYFMHLSVGSFTKGLGFLELQTDLLALLTFVPVLILGSTLLLRKQER